MKLEDGNTARRRRVVVVVVVDVVESVVKPSVVVVSSTVQIEFTPHSALQAVVLQSEPSWLHVYVERVSGNVFDAICETDPALMKFVRLPQ